MLQYALFRNQLTQGDNDFVAIPQSLSNKRIEDIIAQITKPGSILKQTECTAVIHDFFRAISDNLKEGVGFSSPYIRIKPGITGVFNGVDDQFDLVRHQKQINISAAGYLKDAVTSMRLEKVAGSTRVPVIKSVFDFKSDTTSGPLSPGHLIEVRGQNLKVDPTQADEGIYLIRVADGSEVKLDTIHANLPSRVSVMLPDNLAAGSYNLEVRSRLSGNKSLSIGVFSTELSVN